MKKISRNIYTTHDYRNGELVLFRVRHKTLNIFLTRVMAEEARMEYDFEKQKWFCYTVECLKEIPEEFEIKSKLKIHPPTGKWYVELDFLDDKIVSDLYATKKEAKSVQKYLDSRRWSVKALNHQKREKVSCSRKYSGILPIKGGFLLVDSEKNEYGIYDTLNEAENERNRLRNKGVLI